jgi:hypothetical protein
MTGSSNDSGLLHAHTICVVGGCGLSVRSVIARIAKHYMRVRRHGSTEKLSTRKDGKLEHTEGISWCMRQIIP